MITIIDAATGEVIVRELNEKELAQREADRIAFEKAEEARKAAKKAELLAKLGLTEDDAKLLLS